MLNLCRHRATQALVHSKEYCATLAISVAANRYINLWTRLMTQLLTTRAAQAHDVDAIATIADATLFPGDMTADMIAPYLSDPSTGAWRVAELDSIIIGFAFAEPEPMTDATWNMRAIAVDQSARRKGAGAALINSLETHLKGRGRLLVIDTTQLNDQAAGRGLYAQRGYQQVSVIPDYWENGADKITFTKRL